MGNGVSAVTGGGGVVGKELWASLDFWDVLFCGACVGPRFDPSRDKIELPIKSQRHLSDGEARQIPDAVSYERELTGMDSSAAELLERYRNLASGKRDNFPKRRPGLGKIL